MIVVHGPQWQAAIGPGGVIFYTPNPNFVGTDSFTYTIGDLGRQNRPPRR